MIVRFELEAALMEGRLSVVELPVAWNDRYRELLGVEVPGQGHRVSGVANEVEVYRAKLDFLSDHLF